MTVQRSLKNELQPHLSKSWKIPSGQDAAFVAAMENMLEVYRLLQDPRYPVVCMDRVEPAVGRGSGCAHPHGGRHGWIVDYEYVRHGAVTFFFEI